MTLQPKARQPKRAGIIDGLDMQKFEVPQPTGTNRCAGTVAMVTRDKVSAPTAISMMADKEVDYLEPGEYVKKYIIVGNVLTFQRNECIQQMEGDWILFIDSDMAWQPDAIKTIVEDQKKWDLDIVGGLCFQRLPPYQPTLYKATPTDPDSYTYLERWPEDSALEVDATGMAFCLIHKRVFERILKHFGDIEFPDFEERQKYVPIPFFRWQERWGEDFLFCREAKASGSKVYVDTGVKIKHMGEQSIGERDFWTNIAIRHPDADKFRAKVLEEMGETAMTRADAMEMLGAEDA